MPPLQPAHVVRLLDSALFQGLSAQDLTPLLGAAWIETVMPGAIVLAEGQRGDHLFFVLTGQLKVILSAQGLRRRLSSIYLNTLGPSDFFGEYGLFDQQRVSASVIALTPTRLAQIPKTALRAWLTGDSRRAAMVYQNLARRLIERLRRKDQELDLEITPVRLWTP